MSINVNDKNLGHATAYAYYKAGGGTMTEAEFTEFMADFGTASQTAVEAAQAALASKNAAQTAATTATNKATEATTAAQTATSKAAEASTSASTATSAKDTAVSASQTATTKATEATTAAATATSAATTATTAKDDAVSAKTAAQTAQTGAETAAASVAESAAQIQTNAEDISQLKSAVTQYGKAFIVDPVVLRTEHFYISANGATNPSTSWTADIIQLGDETAISEITAATNTAGFLACAFYNSNTISAATFISGAAFTKTGNETIKLVSIPAGAVLCVISSRTATTPDYSYTFVSAVNLPEFYDGVKNVDVMESEDAVFRRGYVLSTGAAVFQQYWNQIAFNCENVETLIKVKGRSNGSAINLVSFFADADMTQYISGVNYSNIRGDTINTLYNVKVPTTAKVCAVSSNSFSAIEIVARLKIGADTLKPLFIESQDQQLRCMFKDVLFDNDFTVVDDELWGGRIVDVDTGETTINIYKMDKGKHGITYNRSISTDFNHLNVFSYNPANDCLLFSNSANDASTEGNWFAIVKNPRGLGDTAELADVGIKYDVDVGYKVNAFWGDADLGENNIVYLVSNGIGLITKVMLNKTNGEFDGTYSVLDSHDTEEVGYVGGGCYWNNKLYIGNGAGLGYRELDLTDDTFKMVGTQFYDGSDVLNGSSQGMHLDAKYLWRMLNKGGTSNNWVLQYFK